MDATRRKVFSGLTGVVAGVLVIVATALAPPASAAGPASVTLDGRGWGHGKGLSQYGAQNAASKHGQTSRQILDFYYPGTRVGAAGGNLRVLLTDATSSRLTVSARPGLRVRSVATGASVPLARSGARYWRIVERSGSRNSVVWVNTAAAGWKVVRHVGGDAEFYVTGGTLRLHLPEGSPVYRGALRSAEPLDRGPRQTVNVVNLEHYLRGVVPQEVPASWHAQAVRAQAVAARTYAVYERNTTDRGHFDVWDTTRSQVYGGVGAEESASTAAIKATKGQVRTYDGKAAFTQFGSSNGGWTASGSQSYQVAKKDSWDLWAGNPHRRWTKTITDDTLERAYPKIGDFQRFHLVRSGGRVTELQIVGSRDRKTITGAESVRTALGLKSSLFTVR